MNRTITLSIAGVVIFVLLIIYAAQCGQEYADGPGKQRQAKQDSVMQQANDMFNNFPTAAGKKK
jgi:hypothetical protein